MEKKQNKVLLVSAVIGALFVVGVIIFWVFALRMVEFSVKALFISPYKTKTDTLISIGMILSTVCAIISFILNLIGWIKGNNKHILIAGILYVLGLNLISATLCFVEYFGDKSKINNKLLLYTMIYTFIFGAIFITIGMLGSSSELKENFKEMLSFWIYFISTIGAGVIFNFIAWKKDNNIAKIIAGIAYILGSFTIISGVICFISARHFLKAIKNKLLFYAMAVALFVFIMVTVGIIYLFSTDFDPTTFPIYIYVIFMAIAGFIINYFAWKTNNKKAKIIAGIVYIIGTVNIVSAILCFISCKDNRKLK